MFTKNDGCQNRLQHGYDTTKSMAVVPHSLGYLRVPNLLSHDLQINGTNGFTISIKKGSKHPMASCPVNKVVLGSLYQGISQISEKIRNVPPPSPWSLNKPQNYCCIFGWSFNKFMVPMIKIPEFTQSSSLQKHPAKPETKSLPETWLGLNIVSKSENHVHHNPDPATSYSWLY